MRIEINEPQAIWEIGQQTEQRDNIYPPKGEADQADRIFIVCSGNGTNGATSKDIIKNISGYFKRYRLASGEISDDDIRAAIDTCRATDNTLPSGISIVILCMHHEGITVVCAGNSHFYQIRPSAKRIVYEYKGSEKATLSTPSVYHTDDIVPGDYFYACSNGMLEQTDSNAVCQFFSEEGSDDKKRNMLRSSTSGNKANHAAIFIKVRSVIGEDGKELAERRSIVIPDIKSAKPISNPYDNDDDDEEEVVVKPTENADTQNTPKPQAKSEVKKPQPQKQHSQTKHQPRPISRYDDERKQTNTRMVVLVAVIVVLAIAAGMLWYFNSSTGSSLPVDTTTVEPEKVDTTATQTSEPADSAIIPDSAIAEPERTEVEPTPKRRTVEPTYKEETEEEPSTEATETTEPTSTETDHHSESETPKPASKEPQTSEPATSTTE